MGIVFGKPERKEGVSVSAVRRIVNKEINARNTTRRKPNTTKANNSNAADDSKEEMPEEFKDAMREAGLDPDDSGDIKQFLNSLNQAGGRKRRAKHKRK